MNVSVKNRSGLRLEKSRTRVKAGRIKQYTGTVRRAHATHAQGHSYPEKNIVVTITQSPMSNRSSDYVGLTKTSIVKDNLFLKSSLDTIIFSKR